jgi:histidinol-phosphatase (PHP family)
LSDDSHGVNEVGLNYQRVLTFISSVGMSELYYLKYAPGSSNSNDARFPHIRVSSMAVSELESEPFWKTTCPKPDVKRS